MDTEKHAPWNKAHFLFFQMWLFGVSIRQNSSNVLPKITNHHQPIQILILSLMCLESHQTITPTPPQKRKTCKILVSVPFHSWKKVTQVFKGGNMFFHKTLKLQPSTIPVQPQGFVQQIEWFLFTGEGKKRGYGWFFFANLVVGKSAKLHIFCWNIQVLRLKDISKVDPRV